MQLDHSFQKTSIPPPWKKLEVNSLPLSDRLISLLARKTDAFGLPNSGGKGKLFSTISPSKLLYLKRNSFNSHYYYNLTSFFDGVPG